MKRLHRVRGRTVILGTLAVLALMFTYGCDEPLAPTPVPQGNQTQVVNVVIGTVPSPNASPSPSPSQCVREAIDSVRVGPFSIVCPSGTQAPKNGAGIIPFGCTAVFTGTPKDRNNIDVPASLHGSQIAWAIPIGAERVRMVDDNDQPFNKHVSPRENSAPGDVQITATVCSVTGTWNGRTTLTATGIALEGTGNSAFVTRLSGGVE